MHAIIPVPVQGPAATCVLADLVDEVAVQLAVAGELRHIAHPAASLAEFDSMIALSEPGAEPMQL